jgi:cytochrome c553
MPKHGIRLIALMIVAAAVVIAAKSFFTDDSFYRYGHYRADSVVEMAALTPQYQGTDYCQGCHEERHTTWSAGVHAAVKCEVCHGAAREHPISGKLPVPTDTVRLCTLCHEAMPTRPATQPQIDVAEHSGTEQCIACHNPHSPKIGEVAGGAAGTEALVAQCSGCHGEDGLGDEDSPPLAGKQADFLARRMQDYKSGTAENPMMNMIAGTLSDQNIADLAAHYASLSGE